MLEERITEEEIDFCQGLFNPVFMSEALFTNFNMPTQFDENEFSKVRLGQLPLLSYEYLVDEDPRLDEKANFRKKEGAGTVYVFGGRLFGKTMVVEKLDIPLSLILNEGIMIITSFDEIHISKVMNWVRDVFMGHPFYKDFKVNIKQKPYEIVTKNASVVGVNMALSSNNPGSAFLGYHVRKIWVEEASHETEQVYKKRIDCRDEVGCIERVAGMTDFTRYSPAGDKFYDSKLKPRVMNLPQFINPSFDKKTMEDTIVKYGGENSTEFKIYVNGEICEDGVSYFDMDRVKKCYDEKKEIKHFEVSKKNYDDFKGLLFLERPSNCENLYICSDIGDGGSPSEVIILSETNNVFHYIYKISLFNLTDEEQYEVFKWLAENLNANIISLDTTDGTGRAIYRRLEKVFPKENLVYCHFGEKIDVALKIDDDGKPVLDNENNPVYEREYVSEWSVKHLRDILYNGVIKINLDYDFDEQINKVVKISTGNRTIFKCLASKDHVFQSFQTFAIAHWHNEFNSTAPIKAKKFDKFGV